MIMSVYGGTILVLAFLELVQLPKLYQEYDGLHLAEKRETQHSILSNNISCGIKAIQPNSIASKVALIVFPHIFFCMLCVHDSLARGQGSGSGAGATVNVCMCLCGNVSEVSTEGGLETLEKRIFMRPKRMEHPLLAENRLVGGISPPRHRASFDLHTLFFSDWGKINLVQSNIDLE